MATVSGSILEINSTNVLQTMNSYVNTCSGLELTADQCQRLLQLSRVDSSVYHSSFQKILHWFYHVQPDSSQSETLAIIVANILLHSCSIRTDASLNATLIKCVETSLFENPFDLPRWRIMFLLAHCKPTLAHDGQGSDLDDSDQKHHQIFNRMLAPQSFQTMVTSLTMDPKRISILTELGKYWYALCFNYGYLSANSRVYWSLFTELSGKPYNSVAGFQDCLIQFGSLYLLLHTHNLSVERTTVNRFLCIFEDKFNDWLLQASEELYCPLQEHRLPQILNILELLIGYSSPQLRQDIRTCFVSPHNSFHCPFVNSSFIKLIESPINNISNTTTSILNLLHLRHNRETHRLEPLPPVSRESSVCSSISHDYITYSGLPTPSANTTTATSTVNSNSSMTSIAEQDSEADNWPEEEQLLEAEKIGAAIQRLNELGFVKMSTE